ncbi:DUF6221 family protein [Streptomyces griseoaurantiacus]|uniref:DUF6221 family protein n=1 Tax=Streptomyces griseoaurantiacus TaxID=68213 RepID=UPI0036EF7789
MEELVEWYGQQLDEDERIARAAAEPEEWVELNRAPQLSWSVELWADPDCAAVVAEESSAYPVVVTTQGMSDADAEARVAHIVAHDPARVLREIDAKRRIIGRINSHAAVMGRDEIHDDLLRSLALPYADRPGYKESWRP